VYRQVPTKKIVTEETLAAVANLDDPETIAKLLPLVTTWAIKPTKTGDENHEVSLTESLTRVLQLIKGDEDTEVS
jgi:hypothetical protein